MDWFYEKQSHVKYDVAYNIYTICNIKITAEVFEAFNSQVGKKFEVKRVGDETWVTTIES